MYAHIPYVCAYVVCVIMLRMFSVRIRCVVMLTYLLCVCVFVFECVIKSCETSEITQTQRRTHEKCVLPARLRTKIQSQQLEQIESAKWKLSSPPPSDDAGVQHKCHNELVRVARFDLFVHDLYGAMEMLCAHNNAMRFWYTHHKQLLPCWQCRWSVFV